MSQECDGQISQSNKFLFSTQHQVEIHSLKLTRTNFGKCEEIYFVQ